MPLEIIGAGLGRTGTSSLRQALIELGYPCGHMFDLLFDPVRRRDLGAWQAVADAPDAPRDWEPLFRGQRAVLDFPACAVWRPLARAYPEAKVILSLHPGGARAWVESARSTIYRGTGLDAGTPFARGVNDVMDRLVWDGLMRGTMGDPAAAAARYDAHAAEVRAALPPRRLLAFSVDQGWGPLCAFLGQAVPDRPFPNVNSREEMGRLVARIERLKAFGLGRASGAPAA